jgi:hypothetical protein
MKVVCGAHMETGGGGSSTEVQLALFHTAAAPSF